MATHIALVGDSIFDNAAYTSGEPDVVSHLLDLLPAGHRAALLAVDGATTAGIPSQVARVPSDVTHVVVSIGGNDALGNADLLSLSVRSSTEALAKIADRLDRFEADYRIAIDRILSLKRDTTVCTIYNGNLSPLDARVARIGLMSFNDVILRVAFEHSLRVIDLRLVCSEPADYANPIEPSGSGGRKIAASIVRALGLDGKSHASSSVFA